MTQLDSRARRQAQYQNSKNKNKNKNPIASRTITKTGTKAPRKAQVCLQQGHGHKQQHNSNNNKQLQKQQQRQHQQLTQQAEARLQPVTLCVHLEQFLLHARSAKLLVQLGCAREVRRVHVLYGNRTHQKKKEERLEVQPVVHGRFNTRSCSLSCSALVLSFSRPPSLISLDLSLTLPLPVSLGLSETVSRLSLLILSLSQTTLPFCFLLLSPSLSLSFSPYPYQQYLLFPYEHRLLSIEVQYLFWSITLVTGGALQPRKRTPPPGRRSCGIHYRGQYDRLIGASHLIRSGLRVQLQSRTKRSGPPYIGIPPSVYRLI